MIRRWSRKTKQIMAAVSLTFVTCALVALIGWALLQRQWIQERAQYEREIEQHNTMIDSIPVEAVTSAAWQFTRRLQAGDVITSNDIEFVRLDSESVAEGRVKEKEKIVGQLVKIDVEPRIMVVPSMLAAPESLNHDIRWVETAVIQLPIQLKKADVLDIRIRFPNGLDYIVVSHKKVLDLQKPTMWMHLSEQELLLLSSAYVDAYVHGGQLYAVRYVDHMIQDKAIVNYPVREDVLDLIHKDPNIVKLAQAALSEQSRKVLEQQLSDYQLDFTTTANSNMPYGTTSTTGNGTIDPLAFSPFTGLAPESHSQSPFVGEAANSQDSGGTNVHPSNSSDEDRNASSSMNPDTVLPNQQNTSFEDPDLTINAPEQDLEMRSSQSQVNQNGQP